jgi:hypothetical protein
MAVMLAKGTNRVNGKRVLPLHKRGNIFQLTEHESEVEKYTQYITFRKLLILIPIKYCKI